MTTIAVATGLRYTRRTASGGVECVEATTCDDCDLLHCCPNDRMPSEWDIVIQYLDTACMPTSNAMNGTYNLIFDANLDVGALDPVVFSAPFQGHGGWKTERLLSNGHTLTILAACRRQEQDVFNVNYAMYCDVTRIFDGDVDPLGADGRAPCGETINKTVRSGGTFCSFGANSCPISVAGAVEFYISFPFGTAE